MGVDCKCGHLKLTHDPECKYGYDDGTGYSECSCREFTEAAE